MGFSDFQFFPTDGEGRDPRRFPVHGELHCYLRDFCDAFGLMDTVRLNTRVLRVAPAPTSSRWAVRSVRLLGTTEDDDVAQEEEEVHLAASSEATAATPAMSRVLMLANHGDVLRLHAWIRRLQADGRVEFADGSSVVADTVIYCTGYTYSFPFLDTAGAVTIDSDGYVVGPLFEHVLSGRRALPAEEEMLRSVEEHLRAREAAGVPRKLTHNIGGVEREKVYEFGEKYSDLAPLEE
uniref:Flavin-containing monooxygenase n=1 Tax=Aegilops tauschii TaxID=37682 RepID=M8CBT0_AEGTA